MKVKIEHFTALRLTSFPRNPSSEKANRQADALAVGRRDIFHGVRRHLRNGTDCARRRIWTRDFDFAVDAGAVELADGVHDRRTVERPAAGTRILRLGDVRTRKFPGISGTV